MHFARYETPMIAGFRKYAPLYRKAATMQSRGGVPARLVRPPIGNSPFLIRSRRDRLQRRVYGDTLMLLFGVASSGEDR